MTQDPYILITADTHGGGSHAQYREYLDPQWREPFDQWRGGYKNPSQEHYGSKKMRNWDYGIRNKDQDSQGVVGEVVFPNTVPPFYRKSIVTAHPPKPEDYQRCQAGIRAHNRWLKDFCRRGSGSSRRNWTDPAQRLRRGDQGYRVHRKVGAARRRSSAADPT